MATAAVSVAVAALLPYYVLGKKQKLLSPQKKESDVVDPLFGYLRDCHDPSER